MDGLTRFPRGSIREVIAISYPILLSLLSACIMSLCDRYFLSRHSVEAFEGVCLGGYLTIFFQFPCMRLTAINQTFISQALGEKNREAIAPYTWQTIWTSFFTILPIISLGLLVNHYYFAADVVGKLGSQYFLVLLLGNFLFALGAGLSGFHSGIGETKVITRAALCANAVNVVLNYLLIFGVQGYLPPLGIVGAAIGTVSAQAIYCLFLFLPFIRHREREAFQIRNWRLAPTLFGALLRVGAPSAFNAAVNFFYWLIVVQFVSQLGGDYLLVLSYGSALWVSIPTFFLALRQGAVSLFSFFLGENNIPALWKTFRSCFIVLLCMSLLSAIPLVLFSTPLIHSFFPEGVAPSSFQILQATSVWIWIYFFVEGGGCLIGALIVSLKKTMFTLKLVIVSGLITLIAPYYFAFYVFHWSADKVWMVNWLAGASYFSCTFIKAFLEINKRKLSLALKVE